MYHYAVIYQVIALDRKARSICHCYRPHTKWIVRYNPLQKYEVILGYQNIMQPLSGRKCTPWKYDAKQEGVEGCIAHSFSATPLDAIIIQ